MWHMVDTQSLIEWINQEKTTEKPQKLSKCGPKGLDYRKENSMWIKAKTTWWLNKEMRDSLYFPLWFSVMFNFKTFCKIHELGEGLPWQSSSGKQVWSLVNKRQKKKRAWGEAEPLLILRFQASLEGACKWRAPSRGGSESGCGYTEFKALVGFPGNIWTWRSGTTVLAGQRGKPQVRLAIYAFLHIFRKDENPDLKRYTHSNVESSTTYNSQVISNHSR